MDLSFLMPHPRDPRNQAFQDAREVSLALCMLSKFIFSSNSDMIYHIYLTLRNCTNPMGKVLVETLKVLDIAFENRAMLSFGAAFILQAWTYGRLNFLRAHLLDIRSHSIGR